MRLSTPSFVHPKLSGKGTLQTKSRVFKQNSRLLSDVCQQEVDVCILIGPWFGQIIGQIIYKSEDT